MPWWTLVPSSLLSVVMLALWWRARGEARLWAVRHEARGLTVDRLRDDLESAYELARVEAERADAVERALSGSGAAARAEAAAVALDAADPAVGGASLDRSLQAARDATASPDPAPVVPRKGAAGAATRGRRKK